MLRVQLQPMQKRSRLTPVKKKHYKSGRLIKDTPTSNPKIKVGPYQKGGGYSENNFSTRGLFLALKRIIEVLVPCLTT